MWQTSVMGVAASSARSTSGRLGAVDWVEAALTLIGDEGLAAVKIDRLAQQLGVTKGSFYWHFEDLAAFLVAVADQWCRDRSGLKHYLDGLAALSPRERLAALTELVVDPRYWRLERASREWARTNRRVREMLARSDRWILDVEREAYRELGFDDVQAELRASALFYAGMGWILAGSEAGQLDRKQVAALVDILTA